MRRVRLGSSLLPRPSRPLWALLATAAIPIALAACGSPANDTEANSANTDNGPVAELGSGWDELITITHGSEIKIMTTGHFRSSRQQCPPYQAVFGRITPVELSNRILRSTNAMASTAMATEEYCFPRDNLKNIDGYVDLKVNATDRKPLFTPRGSEICTKIRSQQAAKELLGTIDEALGVALKEGC